MYTHIYFIVFPVLKNKNKKYYIKNIEKTDSCYPQRQIFQ